MKKIILCALLTLFVGGVFAQSREVLNPAAVTSSNSSSLTITKVELLEESTKLYFDVQMPPKYWFRMVKETYITVDDVEYQLQSAEGLTIDKKRFTDENGEAQFVLIFDAIPFDSKFLDFEERVDRGYHIVDINISAEGVQYPVDESLMGNWYSTDGASKYLLGFKDSVVLYDNDLWRYAAAASKKSVDLVHFQNPDRTRTLYYKMGKDGVVLFGDSPKELQPLTQSRIYNNDYTIPATVAEEWAEESFFTAGKATLRGHFEGYSPKLGATRAALYLRSAVAQDNDQMKLVKVSPDGTFEVQIDLPHPMAVGINFDNFFVNILVSPNDTLTMSLPIKEINSAIYYKRRAFIEYMGDSGLLNAQFARWLMTIPDYNNKAYYKKLDIEEYKEHINERWESLTASAQSHCDTTKLIPNAERYITNHLKLKLGDCLNVYPSQRAYHIKVEEKELEIPYSFYEKYRELPLDDFAMLASADYYFFVNGVQYFGGRPWLIPDNINKYIELNYSDLSQEDGIDQIYLLAFVVESALDFYRDSLGLEQSFFTDVIALNIAKSYLTNVIYYDDQRPYEAMLERIGSPRIRDIYEGWVDQGRLENLDRIIEYRVELALERAKKESGVVETPEKVEKVEKVEEVVEQKSAPEKPAKVEKAEKAEGEMSEAEQIIYDNLEPLRGQIVLLDFWAMWCSPCRSGMMESYRHKDAMSGYNMGFAYVTTEQDSPKETREKFLSDNEIEGLLLVISNDDYTTIAAEYNITGIPRYMLIGKDGRVINSQYNVRSIDYQKLKDLAGKR